MLVNFLSNTRTTLKEREREREYMREINESVYNGLHLHGIQMLLDKSLRC